MKPDQFLAHRTTLGLTQHALAERLHMGKHGWQSISAWENGSRPIPGPVQIAIEHLVHCKPVRGAIPRQPSTKDTREAIKL